ncbi:MAG: NAD(P)H-dependent oxidoreductase [Deltaproteobacteria bacterium]|nr:NAD(P)H-dependent oxidoreductase [Deltaproteobacteria bacterium]
MATIILSAASPQHPSLQALAACLVTELARTGETDIQTFDLATIKLAYCQGEFDCWVKTPGYCRSLDTEQVIVQAIHDADNLILLDAITFGGHGYTLKRAMDRMICLLAPFFEKRAALTHHRGRYDHVANLFALGWLPAPDSSQARTWREFAEANAINMLAPRFGAAVVDDTDQEAWADAIREMLASEDVPGATLDDRAPLRAALIEAASPERPEGQAVPTAAVDARTAPRVAILNGSAKVKGTSASENLARALAVRLEQGGALVEQHVATEFIHDRGKALVAARAIAEADLFVLVTPLYVDALPALATHALELVAQVRNPDFPPAQFAVIINCGFPEPEQIRTALRIARHFAVRAGYAWAGGLPLGGGGSISPERPLDEQHGPAEHVKRALDLAAPALARREPIPAEAIEEMIARPMPDGLYRLMGDLGWRYQAYRNHVSQRDLKAKPLD